MGDGNKKIGRNERCPCNSGKKYKHCHGGGNVPTLPPFERDFMRGDFHQKVKEIEAQKRTREQQQGLGNSIIAADFKDHKIIAVGSTIHHSKSWKTFGDFLLYYIKHALGSDWGNSEIAKLYEERHPIMQWYKQVCDYQKETILVPGEIASAPMIGVVEAYLQLAYNLYLLAHNKELQARLISRLKHPDQFPGAYYETYVFAVFIKAGFDIEFEDEESGMAGKRCECTATHKISGNKYSIEAKAISRYGVLGAKINTTSKTLKYSIGNQLKRAFKKESDHPRIIFIDLNLAKGDSNKLPDWLDNVELTLREKEKTLQTPHSAYVFLTNHPCHRHPRGVDYGRVVVPFGFKIPDFGYGAKYKSLKDAYYAKKKHSDIHSLMDSIKTHHEIPATFDGSLPSESFNDNPQSCIIGRTYFFEDIGENGIVGTVTCASVNEPEKKIHYGITTEDGSYIITGTISDDEFVDYKKHPNTFFGVVHQQGGKIEEGDNMGLFEFFMSSYKNTPKERLLELMKDHPDLGQLQNLEQEELAVTYCERNVCALVEEKQRESSRIG